MICENSDSGRHVLHMFWNLRLKARQSDESIFKLTDTRYFCYSETQKIGIFVELNGPLNLPESGI